MPYTPPIIYDFMRNVNRNFEILICILSNLRYVDSLFIIRTFLRQAIRAILIIPPILHYVNTFEANYVQIINKRLTNKKPPEPPVDFGIQ